MSDNAISVLVVCFAVIFIAGLFGALKIQSLKNDIRSLKYYIERVERISDMKDRLFEEYDIKRIESRLDRHIQRTR